jgi:hypothetical protein
LDQYLPTESLSDELFHISPHKLHHEDEKADEERTRKQLQIGFQNEYVQLLNKSHVRAYVNLTAKVQK